MRAISGPHCQIGLWELCLKSLHYSHFILLCLWFYHYSPFISKLLNTLAMYKTFPDSITSLSVPWLLTSSKSLTSTASNTVWTILYTASKGCCVSKLCTVDVSPVLCLHFCQCSVPCLLVLYCITSTANAVCYTCWSCIVFALLPARCALWGLLYALCCVWLMYCQCSLPCRSYDNSSYHFYFANVLFLPIPLVESRWVRYAQP